MKSLLQKIVTVAFLPTLLLSLGVSQMLVLPVQADEFTNISDIKGCRAIKGEAERLVCYDTVSGGGIFNEQQLKKVQTEEFGSQTMRKEPVPVTAPPPASASASAVAPATASAASPEPATGTEISVDRLNVTIVRSTKDRNGFHYFQTSGGQVWKQKNASGWSLTVPFDAEIKAGVFGSFFLVNEGGKSTRVKRVR